MKNKKMKQPIPQRQRDRRQGGGQHAERGTPGNGTWRLEFDDIELFLAKATESEAKDVERRLKRVERMLKRLDVEMRSTRITALELIVDARLEDVNEIMERAAERAA